VFELYGRALELADSLIKQQEQAGIPPERVADAVAHALTAKRPKTRYLVGRDAQLLVLIRRLLPDRWRDELILRYTKLPRDQASIASQRAASSRDGNGTRPKRGARPRPSRPPAMSRTD